MLGRAFQPTDIGKIVSKFLVKYFETYVDYGFTATMEDVLDEISNGEKAWRPELERFWKPFSKLVEHIGKTVTREEVAESREIGRHPESGKPIAVRMGAYGPFVQHGTRDDADKPKFASLMPGQHMDDVTLADALKLLSLPRALGNAPDGTPISVGRGQYGPYVKYGTKFASIKEDDPFEVTLPRALEIVAAKVAGGPRAHDPRFPRCRNPGAERPLWPLHHRPQAQRPDPQGPRPRLDDARGMRRAAGRCARARQGPVRQARRPETCSGRSAAHGRCRAGGSQGEAEGGTQGAGEKESRGSSRRRQGPPRQRVIDARSRRS